MTKAKKLKQRGLSKAQVKKICRRLDEINYAIDCLRAFRQAAKDAGIKINRA